MPSDITKHLVTVWLNHQGSENNKSTMHLKPSASESISNHCRHVRLHVVDKEKAGWSNEGSLVGGKKVSSELKLGLKKSSNNSSKPKKNPRSQSTGCVSASDESKLCWLEPKLKLKDFQLDSACDLFPFSSKFKICRKQAKFFWS